MHKVEILSDEGAHYVTYEFGDTATAMTFIGTGLHLGYGPENTIRLDGEVVDKTEALKHADTKMSDDRFVDVALEAEVWSSPFAGLI